MVKLSKQVLLSGVLVLFAVSSYATDIKWTEKGKTVVIDSTFQISKPGASWDTQKTTHSDSPVKWVYHKTGSNPIITLKYREKVSGATAHDYAKQVSGELAKDKIKVEKTENKVVNKRNVSILFGAKQKSGEHYVVGVWRHKDKGFILEGQSTASDFATFKPQFLAAINSVKILKETSK